MKKYFFFDDEHVELDENVERIFHEPVKHGRPVLAPETKLDGEMVNIISAPLPSEDDQSWRLWYLGRHGIGNNIFPLYAESEDGINWHRPNLNLVESAGDRNNNILDTGLTCNGNFNQILLSPNPSWDGVSDQRYSALTFNPKWNGNPKTSSAGLISLSSKDGLRWRILSDHVIPSSDQSQLGCDMEKGLLIATMKLYGHSMDIPFSVPEYGRAVGLSTSTDGGLTWTAPEFIYHADSADRKAGIETLLRHAAAPDYRSPQYINPEHAWTDIYNMPVFPYHGIYLGLPAMFHHSGYLITGETAANQDGLICPALSWSKELRHWERPLQRKPFISLSPCTDKDIYDNGMIFACPPIRKDNELWFYYTGFRISHTLPFHLEKAGLDYIREKAQAAIFLARLRLDGFASMRAGERKGAVLTKPIVVEGVELHVNARTVTGEILAEVRDADSGRVIPGFGLGDYLASRNIGFAEDGERTRLAGLGTRRYDEQVENEAVPFSGDQVDAVMAWRGGKDLSALKGRKVRILFAMRNADIYSFWFN